METVGYVKRNIIQALNIDLEEDTPIYLGESNILHMRNKHLDTYEKYKDHIEEIIDYPDYVGLNQSDNSLEYVKEFRMDCEYVKIAVRISNKGNLYARTMYILNNRRVTNYIEKGCLIPLTK